MQFNIWILLLFISALVAVILALYASRQSKARVSFELVLLMSAVAIWAFCEGMVNSVISLPDKILWTKISYIGNQTTPVFFLLFVLRYTNKDSILRSSKTLLAMFLIPVITIIIAFIDQINYIIWPSIRLIDSFAGSTAIFEHGFWYYIFILYSYILIILGFVFLFFSIFNFPLYYSKTSKLLLISSLLPFLLSVAYVSDASVLGGIEPTAIAFSISCLLFFIAIFKYGFLDIVPVAREKIVENMRDGVIILDIKNRFTDINDAACRIIKLKKNIVGKDLNSIETTHKRFFNFCLNSKNEIIEFQSDSEDSFLSISSSILRNEKGYIIGKMIIIYDITERKKTEKELKISEERFNQLAEYSRIITWEIDTSGIFTYISPTCRAVLGYKAEKLIGQYLLCDLRPQNECDNFKKVIYKYFEQKKAFRNIENNIQTKDGRILNVITNGIPIFDTKGALIGYRGTDTDITELKKTEEKIKLQNQQLQLTNAEKDKFFSIISHDLRSPIGGFLSLTEMLNDESFNFSPEKTKELTKTMNKSAKNLYTLLENLLEWSLIKRGITDFNPENLLLSQAICDSASSIFTSAKLKNILFLIEIPSLLNAFADRNMFASIFRNLASNAIKFTPHGGKITVSAKKTDNNFIEISITDTGIGMNKKIADNLFRLDINTKRPGTEGELSTGLGLLLCKELVEKNSGRLWFDTMEGKGSTFYFTLPA